MHDERKPEPLGEELGKEADARRYQVLKPYLHVVEHDCGGSMGEVAWLTLACVPISGRAADPDDVADQIAAEEMPEAETMGVCEHLVEEKFDTTCRVCADEALQESQENSARIMALLADAQSKQVPREPTPAMMEAAWQPLDQSYSSIWRAMYDAAVAELKAKR